MSNNIEKIGKIIITVSVKMQFNSAAKIRQLLLNDKL